MKRVQIENIGMDGKEGIVQKIENAKGYHLTLSIREY
jgi:hypothetical protein